MKNEKISISLYRQESYNLYQKDLKENSFKSKFPHH